MKTYYINEADLEMKGKFAPDPILLYKKKPHKNFPAVRVKIIRETIKR